VLKLLPHSYNRMEIENSPQRDKIYVVGFVIRNTVWPRMWAVFRRNFLSPHFGPNNNNNNNNNNNPENLKSKNYRKQPY